MWWQAKQIPFPITKLCQTKYIHFCSNQKVHKAHGPKRSGNSMVWALRCLRKGGMQHSP